MLLLLYINLAASGRCHMWGAQSIHSGIVASLNVVVILMLIMILKDLLILLLLAVIDWAGIVARWPVINIVDRAWSLIFVSLLIVLFHVNHIALKLDRWWRFWLNWYIIMAIVNRGKNLRSCGLIYGTQVVLVVVAVIIIIVHITFIASIIDYVIWKLLLALIFFVLVNISTATARLLTIGLAMWLSWLLLIVVVKITVVF